MSPHSRSNVEKSAVPIKELADKNTNLGYLECPFCVVCKLQLIDFHDPDSSIIGNVITRPVLLTFTLQKNM